MADKNTVILKRYSAIQNEYAAAAAITPGMLVELTSAGTVQAHSNAGQPCAKQFAIEDALQGKEIDDAFATGDVVRVWTAQSGDEVYAILADGENASIGSFLESDGDGALRVYAADSAGAVEYPASIVGVCIEAVNLSDSSGAESSGPLGYDKRVKVRIV